jgi:hypothetical protein
MENGRWQLILRHLMLIQPGILGENSFAVFIRCSHHKVTLVDLRQINAVVF